jgi:hypothetical protein
MFTASFQIKVFCLFGFLLIQFSLFAQKNDTVYLLNGDRLTGELKKFEYGLLTLKTDAMSTVSIEYDRINTVYSAKFYEIRIASGYRYFGSLARSTTPATINIVVTNDTLSMPLIEVVQMTSIKNKFLQRLDGSVDVGLSYTKASNVMQFNLSSKVSYRTTKYLTEFNLSSIITDQSERSITRKNDIGLNLNRMLEGPWFAGIQVKGQQNTELNLEYRYQGGAGGGYDIVRSNSNRLSALAGILVNTEKTLDTKTESENIEGLLSLQYKWFRYRSPKIDLTSGLNAYPSFTVGGRVRLEYDLQAKFEIIKDLFFSITLYDNYDNKPSENENSKNDWGIITSIGYTF